MKGAAAVDRLLETQSLIIERVVTGGAWKENCYLVHDRATAELAVIDPGEPDGETEALVQAIAESGGRLRHILLTHAHHDHVGAAAGLSEAFGIPVSVHPADRRLLRQAPMYAHVFARQTQRAVNRVHELSPEAPIALGALEMHVLEAPGHSPGGVCYSIESHVFTGDTILYESVGRTDLPGADPEALRASVDALCATLPADAVLYPGHGRAFPMEQFATWWREFRAAPVEFKEPSGGGDGDHGRTPKTNSGGDG